MSDFLTLLPPRVRQVIYALFALASAAGSAISAYYVANGQDLPSWLIGGLAALGALTVVPTAVAATKVTTERGDDATVVPQGDGKEPLILS